MTARPIHALLVAAAALAVSVASHADTGPCGKNIGGALPDLVVNAAKLAQYLSVGEEKSAPASCAVQEGFVGGPGWHTLMRFNTSTANVGAGGLVIGNPASCPGLFVPSACHGHMHFEDYASYRLWTPEGYDTWVAVRDLSRPSGSGSNAAALLQARKNKSLLTGRKMGFCMIDTDIYDLGANPIPVYTSCLTSQGISVGWADSYGAFLDGQYVEVDTLKSGDYVLEVHVNPELLVAESNYTNNSSAIRLRFTARRGSAGPSIQIIP